MLQREAKIFVSVSAMPNSMKKHLGECVKFFCLKPRI